MMKLNVYIFSPQKFLSFFKTGRSSPNVLESKRSPRRLNREATVFYNQDYRRGAYSREYGNHCHRDHKVMTSSIFEPFYIPPYPNRATSSQQGSPISSDERRPVLTTSPFSKENVYF